MCLQRNISTFKSLFGHAVLQLAISCWLLFLCGYCCLGRLALCELNGWLFMYHSCFSPCWVLPNYRTRPTPPRAAQFPEDRAMYWVRPDSNLALVSFICWQFIFRWLCTVIPSFTFFFLSVKHSHIMLLFLFEERYQVYQVIITWSLNLKNGCSFSFLFFFFFLEGRLWGRIVMPCKSKPLQTPELQYHLTLPYSCKWVNVFSFLLSLSQF